MRIPRRRFIAGAVSGLGALALEPLAGGVRAETAPAPRLLLVGDSLTGSTARRRELHTMLRASDLWSAVAVNAKTGREINEALPLVRAHKQQAVADAAETVYVIALGTNDLSHTWLNTAASKAELVSRVEAVLAEAAGSLVIWTNTSFSRRKPGYPGRARRFNTLLAEVAARTPNMAIIDWYASHLPSSPLFASDGIHLSSTGFRRRARLTATLADQYAREFFAPAETS